MANRWWIYQRERFPIFAHGALVAAFSFSAVCFSSLLRGDIDIPPASSLFVAFTTAFLFFLQLRIADEFKDYEEDSRYRPYRPVPRGLIHLWELGLLGVLTGVAQLSLALWLEPRLIPLLGVTWLYLALMSKEFFVADWLKKRHVLYMTSHMIIMPLVDFYATACDWVPKQEDPPQGIIWFVIVSYFNGLVIEIGRKIRAPQDEEEGVNTYSSLWGPRAAVLVWAGTMVTTAVCASIAAYQIHFLTPVLLLLAFLLTLAGLNTWLFLRQPRTDRAKRVEHLSGLWTLLMYLGLGAIPLLWRWAHSTGAP